MNEAEERKAYEDWLHQSPEFADTIISAWDVWLGRAALAQPEPEPVAWINEHGHIDRGLDAILEPTGWAPLYTAPPQRKPLRTVIYACPICAASLERQE